MKNYQLLVTAQSDVERRAAVELTPARKLREMRMALTLDKTLSKAEILTRYLNLVYFGNGAFGVQDAARSYFRGGPVPPPPPEVGSTVVEIPGLPPITVPLLGPPPGEPPPPGPPPP